MAATSSARSAHRVVSALNAMTVETALTVATAHHAMANEVITPSALQRFAMTQRRRTLQHQPKKAATSPVKTDARVVAKADVVDAHVDAVPSVVHGPTKTVSRWKMHKPH